MVDYSTLRQAANRRGTGTTFPARPPTELGQDLPSPYDVGWNPWEAAKGAGRWAGQKFMGLLDWLVGFGRIGTQALAGIDEWVETGHPNFQFNWWKYEDPNDPHEALRFWGGATTLGAAPDWITNMLPDTPEQAAEILRERAKRVAHIPVIGKAAEALPFIAGLWNEHFVAEVVSDPLWLLEAPIKGVTVGMRMLSAIKRASVATLKWSEGIQAIAPLSKFAQNKILGLPYREAGRLAEGISAPRAYTVAGRQALEMGTERQAAQILGLKLGKLPSFDMELREVLGAEQFAKMLPAIDDLIETAPDALRNVDAQIQQLLTGQAGIFEPGVFLQPQLVVGGKERFELARRITRDAFPEAPDTAIDLIAKRINRSIEGSSMDRLWAEANHIPIHKLEENQYMLHAMTQGARAARQRAMRGAPAAAMDAPIVTLNDLPSTLVAPLRTRKFKQTITAINKAMRERGAFDTAGKLRMLTDEQLAKLPRGWVRYEDDLFITHPGYLSMAANSTVARAVDSVQFFDEAARSWGKPFAEIPPEMVDKWKSIPDILKGGVESREWKRTFGRLGKDLKERIRGTYFPDEDTARAVMSYMNAFRGLQQRPGAVLRYWNKIVNMWRAATLTPFMPFHARNTFGGIVVNEQAGVNALHYIDSIFANTRARDFLEEFSMHGGFSAGEVTNVYKEALDWVYVAPLEHTAAKSGWKHVVSKYLIPWADRTQGYASDFWGRSVAKHIENNQRLAHYIGMRQRGMSVKDAMASTHKHLFNYNDIPPWQRFAKPVTAFPTWSLKMIPLQAEMLFLKPSRFALRGKFAAASMRAAGLEAHEVPEFIREGGGFGIPALDPDRPLWFRPENFDPLTIFSEIADPIRFGYEMLNPFVTEPFEQLMAAHKVGGRGEPTRYLGTFPLAEGSDMIGYDWFFKRPIDRPYAEWNPLLPGVGGTEMPWWAQRTDHAMRSFLRVYNEFAGAIKIWQREWPEGTLEVVSRRVAGVPFFWQEHDSAIYFNLKGVNQRIADEERSDKQNPQLLKDLYLQQLGLLAHGTFAQRDPFSGELRHWKDYGTDDDRTLRGRRGMWQSAIQTCFKLLIGSTGPSNMPLLDQPIPLDETEAQYIEGLLHRLLDTYTIEVGNAAARGEVEYGRSVGYAETRQEALW